MNTRSGGTLVEVMMACVVLSAIALAGGAYMVQSSRTLAISRERFQVLAIANSRMEEVRATKYNELSGLFPPGLQQVTIVKDGAIWKEGASETVSLGNGANVTLVTDIQKFDVIQNVSGTEGVLANVEASTPLYKVGLKLICVP